MALKSTGTTFGLGAIAIDDTDVDENARKDIIGGAGYFFSILIVNPHADAAHLYLYDDPEPVVGTTDVDWSLRCPGNMTIVYTFTDGAGGQGGVSFINLSMACVKEVSVSDGPGGSGSTAPSGTMIVRMVLKAS